MPVPRSSFFAAHLTLGHSTAHDVVVSPSTLSRPKKECKKSTRRKFPLQSVVLRWLKKPSARPARPPMSCVATAVQAKCDGCAACAPTHTTSLTGLMARARPWSVRIFVLHAAPYPLPSPSQGVLLVSSLARRWNLVLKSPIAHFVVWEPQTVLDGRGAPCARFRGLPSCWQMSNDTESASAKGTRVGPQSQINRLQQKPPLRHLLS